MDSKEVNIKEIGYMLLQDKYLKVILGKDNYTTKEVMLKSYKLFPKNWSFADLDMKNRLITKAIKEKRSLVEIYNREMNPDNLPPKLDVK